MRFEVLGPLRAAVEGRAVPLGSPQQQKLLAVLLTAPNQTVSTDRLIDEMWGEVPPPSARHLVQVYVSRLRKLLGSFDGAATIEREGAGYVIRVDPEAIDASRMEETVVQARRTASDDPARAVGLLHDAIGLWRGRPYGDLADESPTLQAESVRLEELYLGAVEDRVEAELQIGNHQDLVGDLERLTEQHPYRERFWQQLMLALYRCGRQVEALRVYQTLRNTLGDDLGLEPSFEVRALETQILLQDPDLLWEPLPPPTNLPARLSSFVGRSQEIAEVSKLVETARLVTLTGPGGIGKTRLALEVAERLRHRFPDGVWWVDLAPESEPDMVVDRLAAALGVIEQPGSPLLESITRSLQRREALLLIDNCEHVLGAVAETVGAMLAGGSKLRVLATSRTPLRVTGEALWIVPALAMPLSADLGVLDLPAADAIRLFVERGTAVDPAFDLDEQNAPAVVELCRRLDAMPLAIEMAAARLRVLSPGQIATLLGDRFSLLAAPEHDADPRHRTLETAIDWSYELLTSEEQAMFDRLAVFTGEFDLEAAGAMAPAPTEDVLGTVTRLVEASMVTIAARGDVNRYRLLETLRAYAAGRLRARGAADAAQRAHADYFLGLVEQSDGAVGTPAFAGWVERLHDCYDDVRKALGWSLDAQPRAVTLQLAGAMFHYWYRTGNAPEAGHWGNLMLRDADAAAPTDRAAAHMAVAFSGEILGDPDLAQAHMESAVTLYRRAGDKRGLAFSLFGREAAALQAGDLESVRNSALEGLAICDEIGDRWGRAPHLADLSFVHFFGGGSLDEARRFAEEALELHRELGDRAGQVILNPLAGIALKQGDLNAAERFADEVAVLATGTGWEASALVNLADVFNAKGDHPRALATLRRAIARALDTGLENWFRIALRDLARMASVAGEPDLAARLLGASRRNMPAYGLDRAIYTQIEKSCRVAIGDDRYEKVVDEGDHMSHEELIALVLGAEPAAFAAEMVG